MDQFTGFRTVKAPASIELVINKSRFIGQCYPISTEEEALEQLPPHLLEVEGSFCKAYARICRELMDAITQRACSLPEHRVVPYPNMPKKDYPTNI